MTTVRQLIELLKKHDPDAQVILAIGWAADTAYSDLGEDVLVEKDGMNPESIKISSWMSNCATDLAFNEEDTSEADGV